MCTVYTTIHIIIVTVWVIIVTKLVLELTNTFSRSNADLFEAQTLKPKQNNISKANNKCLL